MLVWESNFSSQSLPNYVTVVVGLNSFLNNQVVYLHHKIKLTMNLLFTSSDTSPEYTLKSGMLCFGSKWSKVKLTQIIVVLQPMLPFIQNICTQLKSCMKERNKIHNYETMKITRKASDAERWQGNGRERTGHGRGQGKEGKGGEGLQPPNLNSWHRHCMKGVRAPASHLIWTPPIS